MPLARKTRARQMKSAQKLTKKGASEALSETPEIPEASAAPEAAEALSAAAALGSFPDAAERACADEFASRFAEPADARDADEPAGEDLLPEGESDELYPGDTGTLSLMTRQVLVHLLKGPYFERRKSERLWDEMKRSEGLIRSRLSDLFIELVVDDALGVAFCRKPDMGELDAPSLLNTVRLRFLDSVILLELRERLMRARADGERAVVTEGDIAEVLRIFDRSAGKDDRLFLRHLSGILTRLKERRILLPLRSGDSLEVSPILPLLFPAADIETLRAAYVQRMLENAENEEERSSLIERYQDLRADWLGTAAAPVSPAASEDADGADGADSADEETEDAEDAE